jgi:glyoxylase-like metal-dependent hydrolase (beta-lactamase superfamily II)
VVIGHTNLGEKIMENEIITITVSLPFRVGKVNCYLIDSGAGFVLIDTGSSNQRALIENRLTAAGCKPGDLRLIALTHGDFDHSGNAAYLRKKFGSSIAMHSEDSGMVEHGDMTWNRNKPNLLVRIAFRLLFRLGKSDRCNPDILISDGDDLSEHGFKATVISIPGHSKGSVGFLTDDGILFGGDLLENTDSPALNPIMDDLKAAESSVAVLKRLEIDTVFPGHGQSFKMESIIDGH